MQFLLGYAPVLTLSLLCGLCLIYLARILPRIAGRPEDLRAVQSAHQRLTPRIGGLSVFVAAAYAYIFYDNAPISFFFWPAVFVFCVGLIEDLGYGVSPIKRLLAVLAASLAILIGYKIYIPNIGFAHLELLWDMLYLGIPFTLFVVAGLVNGMNLIDGVNGLSSVTGLIAIISMALIAHQSGADDTAAMLGVFGAGLLGFALFNFPFGLIFMGDAGAYTLGFILAWSGIALLNHNAEVSPWAILLTVYWPFIDTLMAILRRRSKQRSAMNPDRLHVHQLVMRGLEISGVIPNRRVANPITTVILTPFIIVPPLVGAALWNNSGWALAANIVFGVAFFMSYHAALNWIAALRSPKKKR